MNSLTIYKKLDVDIRLNYNSKSEFAKKVGISNQRLSNILKNLSNNKRNILNTTFEILEKAGYAITIEKINHD
ncbi:Transcriptional regulator [Fusobacterium necrophorum subsp. funduliforme]|uniref:hypothetical protein n=1 Tax=Fusobacterium necrophorum TaxID=859 RepID=UPI00370EDE5F